MGSTLQIGRGELSTRGEAGARAGENVVSGRMQPAERGSRSSSANSSRIVIARPWLTPGQDSHVGMRADDSMDSARLRAAPRLACNQWAQAPWALGRLRVALGVGSSSGGDGGS